MWVSATNLKEIVVAFDGTVDKASAENLGSYNLKLDTANVALKSARLQEDGKTVVLTLGDVSMLNQEEYELTVTNVKDAERKVNVSAKDFKFTPVDAALPTVVSVEGLGNKAIKVTFSEPVNVTSTVAGTFKLDDKVVSGILSGNGTRTVIIELFNTMTTGKHTLSINNQVKDFAEYNLVATSVEFDVVEDKVAPTVVEVKDVTLESATVVFSEEVKDSEALKASNYYWMNGSTKHAASSVERIDGKTFKLTFSGDHKLPAVATDLYVTNIVDYSGNTIAEDTKVTISPVIDQTRPEVVSSIFTDNDTLTLTFNKNINPQTFKVANVVLKDKDGKAVTNYGYTISETGTSSRTLTVNFSEELDAGTYTFELTGIQDTTTLKNTALPIVETLVVEDESQPSATSVTGTGNVYYVNFSKAMDISSEASILNTDNYYVKYTLTNGTVRTGKLPASTNLTPVNGNRGVIVTLPSNVQSLDEITIQGVKGANGQYLSGYSKKFAVGDVTNPISNTFEVVDVYATATDKLLVKFNQPVTSVNRTAFTISGSTVAVSDYTIQADSRLVELKLSGKISQDATETITWTNLAAENLTGVKVTPESSAFDIKDAIAPEIKRNTAGDVVVGADEAAGLEVKTVSGNTVVEVNFGENIDIKNTANLINNFRVFQANGLELEFNADFTVAKSSDDNGFDISFSGSSYAGVVYITFDNSNGNVVDASAVRTSDGAAITTLAAKGFNTRTEAAPVNVVTATSSLSTLNNAIANGTPTVAQYDAVGITGVTSDNLSAVNTAVKAARTAKDANLTAQEIQDEVTSVITTAAANAEIADAKTIIGATYELPNTADLTDDNSAAIKNGLDTEVDNADITLEVTRVNNGSYTVKITHADGGTAETVTLTVTKAA